MITKALAILLVCALAALGWQSYELRGAKLELAQRDATIAAAREASQHDARMKDAELANAASFADAQYARGMTDAQNASDALAAALRAGTVQLRGPWRCEAKTAPAVGLPTPAGSQRGDDGALDEQAASAGRIDRATGKCDAQVATWQAYYRNARCIVNKECSGATP